MFLELFLTMRWKTFISLFSNFVSLQIFIFCDHRQGLGMTIQRKRHCVGNDWRKPNRLNVGKVAAKRKRKEIWGPGSFWRIFDARELLVAPSSFKAFPSAFPLFVGSQGRQAWWQDRRYLFAVALHLIADQISAIQREAFEFRGRKFYIANLLIYLPINSIVWMPNFLFWAIKLARVVLLRNYEAIHFQVLLLKKQTPRAVKDYRSARLLCLSLLLIFATVTFVTIWTVPLPFGILIKKKL